MCCLFMEFQGLIDCILVLKSTLLSVAENGDKLGVETFSIAIVTAALTDGSEMSLMTVPGAVSERLTFRIEFPV